MIIHKKSTLERRLMAERAKRIGAQVLREAKREYRKMLREDVEDEIPEEPEDVADVDTTDDVTVTLSKDELDLLKSILDKAGCCDGDCDDAEAEVEDDADEELPSMEDVADVEVSDSGDDAYYA